MDEHITAEELGEAFQEARQASPAGSVDMTGVLDHLRAETGRELPPTSSVPLDDPSVPQWAREAGARFQAQAYERAAQRDRRTA